jgi:hypothetical protein
MPQTALKHVAASGGARSWALSVACSHSRTDRSRDGRTMQGSSISAVRIERTAHPVPPGHVSAGQRGFVVRDRIELSTFRFSEGLSSTREPRSDTAPQPVYQHSGLSGACGSSLAGGPTCAGECRFVRVIGVLDASRARTCVALVLAAAAPVSRRACAPDPACLPVARRPAAGHHLVSHPSSYPCGQAGNNAP